MAIKDILFHLDRDDVTQCEFAVSLAALTGAHLTAAGVAIEYSPLAESAGEFATGWDFSTIEAFAMLADRSRKAVEQAYERLVRTLPPNVHTELVTIQAFRESAGDEFGRLARRFDLSIVSQGVPKDGEDFLSFGRLSRVV